MRRLYPAAATAGILLASTLVDARAPRGDDPPAAKTVTETVAVKGQPVAVKGQPAMVKGRVAAPAANGILKAVTVFHERIFALPRGEDLPAPVQVQVQFAVPAMPAGAVQGQAVFLAIPADNGGEIGPLTEQFTAQNRPTLDAEQHFLASVCKPTADQSAKLKVDGEAALKEAAKQVATFHQTMMHGGWRANMSQPDPRRLIQEALAKSVKTRLSPEQAERYRAEVDGRNANRRQVSVDSLVARLDHDLLLGDDQRDKLVASLTKNWNDAWGLTPEQLGQGEGFVPVVPQQYILPFLNENQKKVYQGANAGNGNMVIWNLNGQGMIFQAQQVQLEVAIDEIAVDLRQAVPAAKVEVKAVGARAVEVKAVGANVVEVKAVGANVVEVKPVDKKP